MMKNKVSAFYEEIKTHCEAIKLSNQVLKELIKEHSDGKNLKGDELVGWLGEIYTKLLVDGTVIDHDEFDYDVVKDKMRISVKTRKGKNSGWSRSGNIPNINVSNEGPTHLMFIHLEADYSLSGAWLFEWAWLTQSGRLIEKRNGNRVTGHFFALNVDSDKSYRQYP